MEHLLNQTPCDHHEAAERLAREILFDQLKDSYKAKGVRRPFQEMLEKLRTRNAATPVHDWLNAKSE